MMRAVTKSLFAAVAATALAGGALADGLRAGSVKDAPLADAGRTFGYSWNVGLATEYVFRGIGQNSRNPAAFGGVDVTYGILYAGAWASDVNYGRNTDGPGGAFGTAVANVELDVYAGIKPVLGPVTFDLGFVSYNYLGGHDKGPRRNQVREQDYVELKAGASASLVPKLTTGVTLFYTPNYQQGQGSVFTVEGTAAYELPVFLRMTPTISGTIGGQFGDAGNVKNPYVFANGSDSYAYWNAGLTLGIDKLSVDFRYWDTDISNRGNFCTQELFACDSRFIATVKVAF